jgi:hypothetical protein
VCVNPTQVCVNPTQVCVNPTQVCVNPTQVCVNPTQAAAAQSGAGLRVRRSHYDGRVEGAALLGMLTAAGEDPLSQRPRFELRDTTAALTVIVQGEWEGITKRETVEGGSVIGRLARSENSHFFDRR